MAIAANENRLQGERAAVTLTQAKHLLQVDKLSEAEAAFKEVIALGTDAAEGFYGLGVVQMRRANYADAAVLFQSSVRLNAQNANAFFYLGQSWLKQGLSAVAFGFFEKALSIDPNHRGAQQALKKPDARPVVDRSAEAHRALDAGSFYEHVSRATGAVARQTKQLIDSLTITATPRLTAHASAVFAPVLCALALFVFAYGVNQIVLPPLLGRTITVDKRHFQNPVLRDTQTFVLLGAGVIAVGLVMKGIATALKVKTTRYTLDKGRLRTESGVIRKTETNYELHRIEAISLRQTALQRLTGDGDLVLKLRNRGAISHVHLQGLARIDDLHRMFARLRSLIVLMRSDAWSTEAVS